VQPFEGSRRGWNNWGGFETRGVYCVLPTAGRMAETEADRQAELARGLNSAHVDPQPSHMVVACCKSRLFDVHMLVLSWLRGIAGAVSMILRNGALWMWLQILTRFQSKAEASASFRVAIRSSSGVIRRLLTWHRLRSTIPM
jgi:hypothetical protein